MDMNLAGMGYVVESGKRSCGMQTELDIEFAAAQARQGGSQARFKRPAIDFAAIIAVVKAAVTGAHVKAA